MFTGLVAGRGIIVSIMRSGGEARLRISPQFSFDEPCIGESVACNGVCLTLEEWLGRDFTAYASAETCACTNLGSLRNGMAINLERALALGQRLGGHLVSGHVDGVATVDSVMVAGESRKVRFSCDAQWSSLIVSKGSVTLDGISLTVNRCGSGWFEVNIIPETWGATTAQEWRSGVRVNLETDMIAKYVRQLLQPYGGHAEKNPSLTEDFLRRYGF